MSPDTASRPQPPFHRSSVATRLDPRGGLAESPRDRRAVGAEHLAYYDAIAPIVSADSIDPARVFRQSRWGKGAEDEDDGAPDGASPAPAGARSTPGDAAALGDEAYVNCPFDEAGYKAFVQAIVTADKVVPRAFEEARYFEG